MNTLQGGVDRVDRNIVLLYRVGIIYLHRCFISFGQMLLVHCTVLCLSRHYYLYGDLYIIANVKLKISFSRLNSSWSLRLKISFSQRILRNYGLIRDLFRRFCLNYSNVGI